MHAVSPGSFPEGSVHARGGVRPLAASDEAVILGHVRLFHVKQSECSSTPLRPSNIGR